MNQWHQIEKDIQSFANPQKAILLSRYFKTKEGEYGYGDVFLGLTLPQSRSIVKKYKTISIDDIQKLLESKYHEYRMIGLLLLVEQFGKADIALKKMIYEFYLAHTTFINNWDLVDLSAAQIVGAYIYDTTKNIEVLKKLAVSDLIWERRIAMIATYQFIKYGESKQALEIADILLHDRHDLIQKAVGWMLREVGKRCSEEIEEDFLKTRYKTMPRTMLRYAIERFVEDKKRRYMKGEM